MKKVYVGNLPYSVTEATLTELFADCGSISKINIIENRETGKPKGFAFIEFAEQAGAEKAVSTKDGEQVEGRKIKVNFAQERTRTGTGAGAGAGAGAGGRRGGNSW